MEVVIYPVPEIELGHDTTLCDDQGIILDAGPGYHSYFWSTDSNSQTITIDTSDFGIGEDTITVTINYYNCVVSDEIAIEFIPCIMDVELFWPSSGYNYSCHLSDSTPVVMQILNSGMMIIPAQDTIYGFCRLDDGPIISDTLILPEDLLHGNTAMLFFDQTLDMSEIKVYDYTIYIYYSKDENASNDTMWGQVEPIDPPVINLGNDTTLCDDQGILLDAGPGYHGYLWSDHSGAQTNTIDVDDIGMGPGIVYVTTQYYDCISSDTIIVTFVTCAGIIDINNNPGVNFYPNPVKNRLTISIHGTVSNTLEIQIVNLTGQVIFNEIILKTTKDYSRQIDLSDYSKGTYFIIVKGDTRANTGKFIVK